MKKIAIIGMSGRFPGARNLEEYWNNIQNGIESISTIDEADLIKNNVPLEERNDPLYVRAAPLLEDFDHFDPRFFGITPREAKLLDPQHRHFLEQTYLALEDAGYAHPSKPQKISIFAGQGTLLGSYCLEAFERMPEIKGKAPSFESYCVSNDYFATRASYKMNLTGPAMDVQTACSSSLVATHLAIASILEGTADMALAGGVTVRVPQKVGRLHEPGGIFSFDGHCRPFDANATGTLFGSGVGVVLLKDYEAAVRDNDRIYASILATAINNDGSAKQSFPAPSTEGQLPCMRRCIELADITPDSINVVEAHGTSTTVGDATELSTLSQMLNPSGKPVEKSVALGSVKANIGHLSAVAGVASLIKMAMCLHHKKIPPQINFQTPHATLLDDSNPCYVNLELKDWEENLNGKPRRGSVDSFGVGGTNAIAILEEHLSTEEEQTQISTENTALLPFVVSAKSNFSLNAMRDNLAQFIENEDELNLEQLSYNLCQHREFFDKRLTVFARDRAQLISALKDVDIQSGNTPINRKAQEKWCYMFSGQGSQYAGMTKTLYESLPSYKQHFDQCITLLKGFFDEDLAELIFEDKQEQLSNTRYTQLALFVSEYCLYKSLEDYGLKPDYVMGHSVGEYVAATVSACMTLEEGLRIVAKRGALIAALPAGGGMLAVKQDKTSVETLLTKHLKDHPQAVIEFGGFNSPEQMVLTGNKTDLQNLIPELYALNIDYKLLDVSHAFHSSLLDPILDDLREEAANINWKKGQIPIVSNLDGELITEYTPDYWVNHARKPVQFHSSINTLETLGCKNFLEIGPSSVLLVSVAHCLEEPERANTIALLRKGANDELMFHNALAKIINCGKSLEWKQFYKKTAHKKMSLPGYVFETQPYWLDETSNTPLFGRDKVAEGKFAEDKREYVHPLLGYRIDSARGEIIFENEFSLDERPFLRDHKIFGHVLFPMVGFVETIASAGRYLFSSNSLSLRKLKIIKGLALYENKRTRTQVIVQPTHEGYDIGIYSQLEGESTWTAHILGQLRRDVVNPSEFYSFPDPTPHEPMKPISVDHYPHFDRAGYFYGDAFSRLRESKKVSNGGVGIIRANPDSETYIRNIGVLESAAHLKTVKIEGDEVNSINLPIAIEHVDIFDELPVEAFAARTMPEPSGEIINQGYWNSQGQCVCHFSSVRVKKLPKSILEKTFAKETEQKLDRSWRYHEHWQEFTPDENNASTENRPWLVVVPNSLKEQSLKEQSKRENFHSISVSELTKALENFQKYAGLINALPLSEDSADYQISVQYTLYQNIIQLVGDAPFTLWTLTPYLEPAHGPSDLALLTGLLRTLRVEQESWFVGHVQCRDKVDLQENSTTENSIDDRLAGWMRDISSQSETELLFQNNRWYVNRIVPKSEYVRSHSILSVPQTPYWKMEKGSQDKGISHLHMAACERSALQANEIEVQVSHVGLNFRDVLNAMELYPGEPIPLGSDCSGVVLRVGKDVTKHKVGDEVFGSAAGCLAKTVTVSENRMVTKPSDLSFKDAASIPVAFLSAYYCLVKIAQVKQNDRVLIHTASGGLGLAAIQIARDLGCTIYATAGSEEKREYLKSIGIDQVFDSRTREFEQHIGTNSVDVVLNTLTGEGFVESSIATCAQGACFIEVSKRNIRSVDAVQELRSDINYKIIDFDREMDDRYEMLSTLSQAFQEKRYVPMPAKVYPVSSTPEAFHFMRETRHIGKLVLEFPRDWRASLEHGHYLITGGLGGVGLELAAWLNRLGVRNIVLTSRSKPNEPSQKKIAALAEKGTQIVVEHVDVNDKTALLNLVNSFPKGKLKGVIHAAGILHNERFNSCSWEDFARVLRPKVEGSINLHEALFPIRDQLDFLLYFSSTAAIFGGHGRASYAGANAYLNQLTQYQRQLGMPAVATCWGAWDEVGMAMPYRKRMISRGTNPMKPAEACLEIEDILDQGETLSVITDNDWQLYTKISVPNDPRFSLLQKHIQATEVRPISSGLKELSAQLTSQLSQASEEERNAMMLDFLRKEARAVLGLPADEVIEQHSQLTSMGLDSLASVEFLSRLTKGLSLNSTLSPRDLMEYPTLAELSSRLLSIVDLSVNENHNVHLTSTPRSHVKYERNVGQVRHTKKESGSFVLSLSYAEESTRKELVQEYLANNIRSVLGISSDEGIDNKTELDGLGLDSLAGVEFLSKVNKGITLSEALSTNDLYQYPTLEQLAARTLSLVELGEVGLDNVDPENLDLENVNFQNKSPSTDDKFSTSIAELIKTGNTQQNIGFASSNDDQLATQTRSPYFRNFEQGTVLWSPLPQDLELSWAIQYFSEPHSISAYWTCQADVDSGLLEKAINRCLEKHPLFFIEISKTSPKFRPGAFKPAHFTKKSYSKENIQEENDDLMGQRIRFELRTADKTNRVLAIIADHLFVDSIAIKLLRLDIIEEYKRLVASLPASPYDPKKDFLHNYPMQEANYARETTFFPKAFEQHITEYTPFYLSHSQRAEQGAPKNWSRHISRLDVALYEKFSQRSLELRISPADILAAFAAESLAKAVGQKRCSAIIFDSGRKHAQNLTIVARLLKLYSLNFNVDGISKQDDLLQQIKEQEAEVKKLVDLPFLTGFFYRKSQTFFGKNILQPLTKIVIACSKVSSTMSKWIIPQLIASQLERILKLEERFSDTKTEHLMINHVAAVQSKPRDPNEFLSPGSILSSYDSPSLDSSSMLTSFIEENKWCLLWRSPTMSDPLQNRVLQTLVEKIETFTNSKTVDTKSILTIEEETS